MQHALPGAISLEVAYAGSKGTHLQVVTDRNQVPVPGPAISRLAGPISCSVGSPPFRTSGNSNYNSLQVKAEKHLSHGLYFLSAFTFSKAINDLPEICCAAPFPQNSYDTDSGARACRLRTEDSAGYSASTMKSPSVEAKSHISNRAVDAVLGGWHVGGIYTLASGFPFSPLLGGIDPSNTGAQVAVRPNQIADGNLPRGQRTRLGGLISTPIPFPTAVVLFRQRWSQQLDWSRSECV